MIMPNPKFAKAGEVLKKIKYFHLLKGVYVKPPRKLNTDVEKYEAEQNLKHFLNVIMEADLKVLDEMIQKRKVKRQWKDA
ncbi:MAG: hypothetical protein KAS92_03665 [Candidatus Omnitrophica bacterium]|nr:hypothetical protein [Candidatus Omnitrophota bacterium]